jgi:hypothetical protein
MGPTSRGANEYYAVSWHMVQVKPLGRALANALHSSEAISAIRNYDERMRERAATRLIKGRMSLNNVARRLAGERDRRGQGES